MQTLMYTLPMLLTSRHQLLVRFKKEKKIIQTCYTAHVRVVRTVMVKSS